MSTAVRQQRSSITVTRGDMFATKFDLRINTVNCVGVMGTGIAAEFKRRYADMYHAYRELCVAQQIQPGVLHVWKTDTEWIVNFPTKRRWSDPSRYEDIEIGLIALRDYLAELGRVKVAIPALGCNNGRLEWSKVLPLIKQHLEGLEAQIVVFEPREKQIGVPAPQPAVPTRLPVVPQSQAPKHGYDPRAHGANCDECPLNGSAVVPPTPASACSVPDAVLIGQEPGVEELRQGRPFIGPSGRKVDKMLAKHGLVRERMHITNAALCLPRQDEDRLKAVKCCAPRLQRELESIPKNVPIVPMGAYAFMSVYGRKMPITLVRGFQWEKDGREIYPTLHPAFVLRDHVQSPLFSRDFRRVAQRIQQGYLTIDAPKSFSVPRTVDELKRLLTKFGPRVACDIETSEDPPTRATLLCIGLSDGKMTVVIPWYPFFRHQLDQFFKTHTIVGHNFFAFDSIVLEKHGITSQMTDLCVPKLEDTLIGHHVFASHMPQRLDHLASFYCDTTPWKVKFGKRASDEKGKPKVPQNEEELFKYNALDVYLTAIIDQRYQVDLQQWKDLYEEDKELAALCRDMQMNGVLVNLKLKDELSIAIREKEKRLYEEMKAIVGEEFAPTKTAHIRRILFEQFKAPVLERTMKGLPSTSKKVLQAFAAAKDRPYGEFCKKLVSLRACSKMRVTYLDNLPVEPDGRVRANWRSFGTPTGRFACRKPNLTNLRRPENKEPEQRIREIYIAPEGKRLVGFDMSQVEPRCAAYVSGDGNMIKAIESGDFHTANAIVLFGELPELLDPYEAKQGKGKNMRTMAKTSGLAVNYLAGADKLYETIRAQGFSVRFPQVVAMLDRLHRAYAGHFDRVNQDLEFVRKYGYLKVGRLSGRLRWLGHAPSPSDCANGPIQGTAADVMNRLLIRIWKRLKKEYGATVKLIAQIHDAAIFEVPNELVETIRKIIQEEADRPVQINGRSVVFPIDLKDGARWVDV
jgi:uracil-DNA glycosylase family 4